MSGWCQLRRGAVGEDDRAVQHVWNFVASRDPDLPWEQPVSGLAVAGIGGLMAGGAWRASQVIDAALTAGAGIPLPCDMSSTSAHLSPRHFRQEEEPGG